MDINYAYLAYKPLKHVLVYEPITTFSQVTQISPEPIIRIQYSIKIITWMP